MRLPPNRRAPIGICKVVTGYELEQDTSERQTFFKSTSLFRFYKLFYPHDNIFIYKWIINIENSDVLSRFVYNTIIKYRGMISK